MNRIIAKKNLSEELVKFEIRTSIAVNEIKVGQYIILNIEKDDAGIPLAVVKTDSEKETITVIVYATDDYTRQLTRLNSGNKIFRIDGPFGYPVPIENFGTVLCVGRGPGIIPLLPVLFSLRTSGNDIITILSAQTREGIILEKEIAAISDEVITITDDGSSEAKGSVCQVIGQILRNNKINHVFVFGSAITIKSTCSHTTKYDIPTQAILYLNKSDQKSGHGIFRVSICGTVKAVCVDGYNFNAYYPNFEEMIKRFGSGDFEIHNGINRTIEASIPV
jgi:NAD(P)H-flavin reductase